MKNAIKWTIGCVFAGAIFSMNYLGSSAGQRVKAEEIYLKLAEKSILDGEMKFNSRDIEFDEGKLRVQMEGNRDCHLIRIISFDGDGAPQKMYVDGGSNVNERINGELDEFKVYVKRISEFGTDTFYPVSANPAREDKNSFSNLVNIVYSNLDKLK